MTHINQLIVAIFTTTFLMAGFAHGSIPGPSEKPVSLQSSQPSEQIENEFSRLNPYYKERAGAFYDIEYVSVSAKALFKIADVRPEQMRGTLIILRAFVDDWLDAYVRGNGSITKDEVLQCVRTMDLRFYKLFNKLQLKQYQIWRDDNSGEYNKLNFLMH